MFVLVLKKTPVSKFYQAKSEVALVEFISFNVYYSDKMWTYQHWGLHTRRAKYAPTITIIIILT